MKVLIISSKYYPEYSGSGLRAHNTYLRLLEKFEIDYDVICNSKKYLGNKFYEYEGVKIFRISSPLPVKKGSDYSYYVRQFISILWQLYFITKFLVINRNKYHLLHTFGDTWTIGFATILFSIMNRPIIRELCNDTNNAMYPIQIHSLISSVFKKKNTLIIAISRRLEKVARKFKPHKIWCRNNPVDEKKFNLNYKKNELIEKLSPFSKGDIILSIVANIIPRKNQLFCLQILDKLPEKFKLIIAGPLKDENLNYYKSLESFISENNLEDRVHIKKGFISNIEDYMKMSDVFLFPSISEGLGTPVLESQACGTPVIANLIYGITDDIIVFDKGGYALKLEIEIWVKHVQKALNISHQVLRANSKEILSEAGSKNIDRRYYQLIEELSER